MGSGSGGMKSWQLGVFFGFCTSFVGCLSKLAIRKSYTMVDTKSNNPKATELAARTIRYAGILGMSALNPIFDLLAMSYASPSLLAPFSGLTLAWIVLLSKQLIGERPQRKQVMAAGLILVGEFFVMAFGDHTSDENTTLDDVVSAYKDPFLQGYFVAEIVYLGTLYYLIRSPGHAGLKRFAWGMAGGSVTSLQCFLKDALTILKASEDKRPWKLPWSFFFLLLLAITTAIAGLMILTACMKRYDATFSNAMNAGAFVVSASIMSAVRYDTFGNLGSESGRILYPFGLAVILFGLIVLVRNTHETTATTEPVEYKQVPHVEVTEARTPSAMMGDDSEGMMRRRLSHSLALDGSLRERTSSTEHSSKMMSLEGALTSPTTRKRTFSTEHRVSLASPLEGSALRERTFSSELFRERTFST